MRWILNLEENEGWRVLGGVICHLDFHDLVYNVPYDAEIDRFLCPG